MEHPSNTVWAGLRLIMTLNIFNFGDLSFKQLNGTAMGTPPGPPYAAVYYGNHEEKILPGQSQCIIYYRQFIDDVISIWYPNKKPQLDALEWNVKKGQNERIPWPSMGIQRSLHIG